MVFPVKDDAVSPVIGTILLVAITVVLVAIVAAVVMGMAGGISPAKVVGVTVTPFSDPDEFGVRLTITGGVDAASLKNLTIGFRDDVRFTLNDIAPDNRIGDPVIGQPYVLIVRGVGQ